eukprot:m51a1_g9364 putative dna ligase (233) ;mRNA; r:175445-176266
MEQQQEPADFFKFPRTRHVLNLGSVSRDDLVMDSREASAFLSRAVIAEEKIDGANLGVSLGPEGQLLFQNRSHYVSSCTSEQFKGLERWAAQVPALYGILEPGRVLFGEWMAAKHSIHYTRLPGYFLAFDVWDTRARRFLCAAERDRLLEGSGIPVVRRVFEGVLTKDALKQLVMQTQSAFRDGPVEGIYLRVDGAQYNESRGKVVRPGFLDNDTAHWSKGKIVKNIVVMTE